MSQNKNVKYNFSGYCGKVCAWKSWKYWIIHFAALAAIKVLLSQSIRKSHEINNAAVPEKYKLMSDIEIIVWK